MKYNIFMKRKNCQNNYSKQAKNLPWNTPIGTGTSSSCCTACWATAVVTMVVMFNCITVNTWLLQVVPGFGPCHATRRLSWRSLKNTHFSELLWFGGIYIHKGNYFKTLLHKRSMIIYVVNSFTNRKKGRF